MDRHRRRLVRAGLLLAALAVVSAGMPLSGASGDAARTRDRDYSAGASDDNGWSASIGGHVRFYSVYRQFKIFGDATVHRGGWPSAYVYVRVRQDVANTANDGRWYTISSRHICCDYDRDLAGGSTGPDGASFWYIGESHDGEYFSDVTQPGHGLKGVWIGLCHIVDGPDVCGRTTYADNPYEPSPPPPGPNLLVNGGFESGATAPWGPISFPGSVNYANYGGSPYKGLRYEEINFLQTSASFGQDVAVNAAPGETYRLSIRMRKPGACGTGKWRGTLTLWGLGGTNENSNTNIAVSPCTGWNLVQVTFTAHNAGHTTLRAEIYGATAPGVNLDLDAAKLQRLTT